MKEITSWQSLQNKRVYQIMQGRLFINYARIFGLMGQRVVLSWWACILYEQDSVLDEDDKDGMILAWTDNPDDSPWCSKVMQPRYEDTCVLKGVTALQSLTNKLQKMQERCQKQLHHLLKSSTASRSSGKIHSTAWTCRWDEPMGLQMLAMMVKW